MSAMVRKRPFKASVRMVAKCQSLPYAPQQTRRLFDHLVGTGDQRRRHGEAKCFGGPKINREFAFGRRLYRQVGGFFALEDAIHIASGEWLRALTTAPQN